MSGQGGSRLVVPAAGTAHPIVVRLFEEMKARRISPSRAAEMAGVGDSTVRHWRNRSVPHIDTLIAMFNALDLDLYIGPRRGKEAPPNVPAGRVTTNKEG